MLAGWRQGLRWRWCCSDGGLPRNRTATRTSALSGRSPKRGRDLERSGRVNAKRDMYLEDIALEEAYSRFFGALQAANALSPLLAEEVSIEDALGRVTAA